MFVSTKSRIKTLPKIVNIAGQNIKISSEIKLLGNKSNFDLFIILNLLTFSLFTFILFTFNLFTFNFFTFTYSLLTCLLLLIHF